MKFKIGDKVKIIKSSKNPYLRRERINKIGIIESIQNTPAITYNIEVKSGIVHCFISESNLELIKSNDWHQESL